MFKSIKNIFNTQPKNKKTDSPGRTFKRILTGDYFGLKDASADYTLQTEAKNKKIAQIKAMNLQPKYVRYNKSNSKIISAHVSFQKEELAVKWNMLHITEISFMVYKSDFQEFESMTNLKLNKDFRDVTQNDTNSYSGLERRKKERA